jgi:molecular chaperone HtpG
MLNPTASRESLRHDDIYRAVQAALNTQLLTYFEQLAADAPLDWATIVQAHNDLIKVWATRTLDLFTRVADLVTFPTSRGKLTIPEYLRQNPGRIFYYQDEDGVTQALALFEARRLAVIDARFSFDAVFLRVYGEVYGVPVEELKPEAAYIFAAVDDREGLWHDLVAAFRAQGFPVRLMAYEPEHLPVILLFPPGAERLRRAQRTVEEGRVAGPIRSLVRGFLDRQQMDESVIKGTAAPQRAQCPAATGARPGAITPTVRTIGGYLGGERTHVLGPGPLSARCHRVL